VASRTFILEPDETPLDVIVVNQGTLWTFTPTTTAGEDWMDDHIPHAQRLGKTRAVEWRYGEGIALAMQEDGVRI
jgi:hypothetical protein